MQPHFCPLLRREKLWSNCVTSFLRSLALWQQQNCPVRFWTGVRSRLKTKSTGAAGRSATRRKWVRQMGRQREKDHNFNCVLILMQMMLFLAISASYLYTHIGYIYNSFGLGNNVDSHVKSTWQDHRETKTMTQSLWSSLHSSCSLTYSKWHTTSRGKKIILSNVTVCRGLYCVRYVCHLVSHREASRWFIKCQ